MAERDDPEQPNMYEGGEKRADALALEARVARLELDLALLQQQIAAAGTVPRFVPRAVPAPPPPLPMEYTKQSEDGAPGMVGWVSAHASKTVPTVSAPDSLESFESRLGSQIFNRIAIVLLLIGTAYGLKLAVDRGLIGPAGRVILGLLAGAGLVLWSERFRRNGFAAFSYSLKAVGSGVLYLSLWAAFQLFHLLPAGAALALMILVTAWNAYMAWVQDSELLAAYALAGGFATPMLVSTGGNHEIFLFTYLLAIDVATVALVRLKTWPRLLLGAFPITAIFFIGWYSEFYVASELTVTSIFVVLFGVVFASVPLGRDVEGSGPTAQRFASQATVLEDILLPLANAAFVALAFYSLLQDSGHHALLPWMMLLLAAAYLGLMQAPQTRTASAIHLSLAVVFLTIAIPLKASGHWITVSWLVEGLALLWVATRLGEDEAEGYASRTLRWLGAASLALGFGGVATHCFEWIVNTRRPFFNTDSGTALVGILIFAGAAWLALSACGSKNGARTWAKIAMSAFVAIDLIALLLTLREVVASWFFESYSSSHLPFRSADFLTALVGLGVFAGVVAMSLRIAKEHTVESFWTNCVGLSTIAFNLIAVLTGVREVSAIWGGTSESMDSGLQQALAISAFLMVYGAALLAVGFWRRSGFLRAQALVLLMFSIFKTFLYDMRSLSQGYRVVSFLGLGALLMAISFAYQKDWLHLREPVRAAEGGSDSDPEARR
jgi:uncharacterized membrane protein